jgi:hypothetical protein
MNKNNLDKAQRELDKFISINSPTDNDKNHIMMVVSNIQKNAKDRNENKWYRSNKPKHDRYEWLRKARGLLTRKMYSLSDNTFNKTLSQKLRKISLQKGVSFNNRITIRTFNKNMKPKNTTTNLNSNQCKSTGCLPWGGSKQKKNKKTRKH